MTGDNPLIDSQPAPVLPLPAAQRGTYAGHWQAIAGKRRMANEEHLARLRAGALAWNTWRKKHPDISPDLSGANLIRANLSGMNLSGTNLDGANLVGAMFSGAILGGVMLSRTLLDKAFGGTNLDGANLRGARLLETVFANVDLSKTDGLEACTHYGPSFLDYRTLQRPGRLPLAFLRGCGLPDRLIDYLPSLFDEAIQYCSCFISYSSKDDAFV